MLLICIFCGVFKNIFHVILLNFQRHTIFLIRQLSPWKVLLTEIDLLSATSDRIPVLDKISGTVDSFIFSEVVMRLYNLQLLARTS